jgi:hypothetical protein
VCGTVNVNAHEYDDVCDEVCNICQETRVAEHERYYACEDCQLCGKPADVGHVYDHECDQYCNVCQAYRPTEHVYSDVNDTDCNKCGETR